LSECVGSGVVVAESVGIAVEIDDDAAAAEAVEQGGRARTA
jgi:hypothetical protein